MAIYNQDGELDAAAVDVLYEIGNVGVGKAIMAIGNIRQMEIRITTPDVITLKKDIFEEIGYDPEQVVVGVSTKMNDTLEGQILFLLSREFVHNTVYEMTEERFDDKELMENEDSVSAIQEMINYMTAGYAKVMGAYLNLPVYISAASVGMDSVKNIIDRIMTVSEETENTIKKVACVDTKFSIIDESGNKTDETGQVLIFPDAISIEKFMKLMEE